LLTCAFVAAIGFGGLSFAGKADAWDNCSSGYNAYYPSYATYPRYASYYGYGPRVAYYGQPVVVRHFDFDDDHHGHHHHHDHDRNFVSFSFGF